MNNLRTILVICCLIGILITVNSCKTPNSGVYGSCKSLRYCDPLKQTLTRRFGLKDNYDWQNGPKSTQMSNFLKKYSILCKNNKVCCGDPLPFSECGETTANNVAGGKKTRLNEYNFMAVVQYKDRYDETVAGCGGSIISNKYVLTAAHCIKPDRKTLHSVVLGEHTKGVDPDCSNTTQTSYCTSRIQTFLVDSYVIHAGYNEDTKENDIALIRLKGDADTSQPNVKTICIASPNKEQEEDELIVTGWGTTQFRDNSGALASDVLLKISVQPTHRSKCEQIFSNTQAVVTNKQFCAGNKRGVETCAGDSGGPAFQIGMIPEYPSDPKFIQRGIVSFSKVARCGHNEALTMYTKVSAYYNWILDNMQP